MVENIQKMPTSYWIKLVIGIAIILGISSINPPAGLETASMRCLAILVGVIYFISTDVFNEHIAGLGALVLCSILNVSKFSTVFSGFSSTTFILLIGAFGLGGVLGKTGLLHRIGRSIVTKFPATFRGSVTAMFLSGLVVSPTMPSGSAKGIIMSLLSTAVGKEMGYKPKSKAATGMFMAGWIPVSVIGTCFMSGSVFGPLLMGLTPAEFQGEYTWIKWFLNSFVFAVIMLVGCYIATLILYKPGPDDVDESIKLEAEEGVVVEGPMTAAQKTSAIVIVVTLIMWLLAAKLKLDIGVIAVGAFVVLMALGIVDKKKGIVEMVPWGTMMFIAFVLSMNSMMADVKLDVWLTKTIGAYLIPLMQNVPLFIAALCLAVYLIRTVIIAQTLACSILFLMLMPIAVEAGLNPYIVAFTIAACTLLWTYKMQTTMFLVAFGAADNGEYPSFPQASKMTYVIMALNIIALEASIPFWRMLGLL